MSLKSIVRVPIFTVLILSIISCGGVVYRSSPRSDDIVVDGSRDDWEHGIFLMKKEPIVVGLQNDNDFLYLMLSTSRKDLQRSITLGGLSVGIKTSQNEFFSIDYPPAIEENSFAERSNFRPDNPEIGMEMKIMETIEYPDEVVFTDKKGISEIISKSILNKKHFELEVSQQSNDFVYELKIPVSNERYALPPSIFDEGQRLTLSLKTGDFEINMPNQDMKNGAGRDNMQGRENFGGNMGSMPQGGNMNGSMPQGGPGGRDRNDMNKNEMKSPEPFYFEIDVELSKIVE